MFWATLTPLLRVHLKEHRTTSHFGSPATTHSSLNRVERIWQSAKGEMWLAKHPITRITSAGPFASIPRPL
jgi:hypothetical protein